MAIFKANRLMVHDLLVLDYEKQDEKLRCLKLIIYLVMLIKS